MTNKYKKQNRNFSPVNISDSLGNIKKNLLYKFGKVDYIIYSKWSIIVGEFFSKHTEPVKINSIKNINDDDEVTYSNHLLVNVSSVAAMEFQHFKNKIIEKINSYFGYKAIKDIKIQQNFMRTVNINESKKINKKIEIDQIKSYTKNINNQDLEESIIKLGLSIKKEED